MSDPILQLIADVREQFGALNNQILLPVKLSETEWNAIAAARTAAAAILQRQKGYEIGSGLRVGELMDTFENALPIVVANFAPEFQEEVMAHAKLMKQVTQLRDLQYRVGREMDRITWTLLRAPVPIEKTELEIGLYKQPRESALHVDTEPGLDGLEVFLLGRIGALPAEAINGARCTKASPGKRKLILRAWKLGREGRKARYTLRKQKFLNEIPLGAVALLSNKSKFRGIYHCSGDVPRGGAHSFYANSGTCYLRTEP